MEYYYNEYHDPLSVNYLIKRLDFIHFFFVLSGKIQLFHDKKVKTYQEGDIFTVNSMYMQHINFKKGELVSISINKINLKQYYLESVTEIKSIIVKETVVNTFIDVIRCMYKKNNFASDLNVIKLLNFSSLYFKDLKLKEKNIRELSLTEKAINYIEKHYREPLTVSLISKKLYVSQGHLSRKFSDDMDVTISEYIRQFRMKRMIDEIAMNKYRAGLWKEYGFSNYQTFLNNFKSSFNLSPTEFIEKKMKNSTSNKLITRSVYDQLIKHRK